MSSAYSSTYDNIFEQSTLKRRDLKYHESKYFITAVIVSLLINLTLVTVILVSRRGGDNADEGSAALRQFTTGQLKSSLCTQCQMFGLKPGQVPTNKHLRLLKLNNEYLCCLTEAESVWKLAQLFQLRSEASSNDNRIPIPSSHLYLDTFQKSNYKWSDEYGYGAAHVTRIQFNGGVFRALVAGLYNVYSFYTFKTRRKMDIPIQVVHSVVKATNCSESCRSVLLQRSVLLSPIADGFTTSYLGAVINLQSQEELSVHVSDEDAIYRFSPSNFFGLYLVKRL